MSNGFVSPGEVLPEDTVEDELHALTSQVYDLPPITRGRYIMDEENLPDAYKELLHGRAFVIDKDLITEVSSASPKTYYISADVANGLIIPGRSMSISADGDLTYVSGDAHYRWTDDGEHWTSWITLLVGQTYSYLPYEKARFAELQAYSDAGGIRISLIVTR